MSVHDTAPLLDKSCPPIRCGRISASKRRRLPKERARSVYVHSSISSLQEQHENYKRQMEQIKGWWLLDMWPWQSNTLIISAPAATLLLSLLAVSRCKYWLPQHEFKRDVKELDLFFQKFFSFVLQCDKYTYYRSVLPCIAKITLKQSHICSF